MGWFEVLNIALNAKQSYDLHQARQKLQEMEGNAVVGEVMKQALAMLKNLVFETANDINSLETHLEETPQPVYVALKLFEQRFREFNVTPSLFPDFSDKEYVRDVQEHLTDAIKRARQRLTPDEINRSEECFLAITQSSRLEEAIKITAAHEKREREIASAREQLQAFENEDWKAQVAKKQKWSLVGTVALIWATFGTCAMGGICSSIPIDDKTTIGAIFSIATVLILFMNMGVATIVAAKLWSKKPSAEYSTLKKKQTELKKIISPKPNDKAVVPTEFQGKTSQELRDIQAARKQLVEEIMSQVDGYDKLLASSE